MDYTDKGLCVLLNDIDIDNELCVLLHDVDEKLYSVLSDID